MRNLVRDWSENLKAFKGAMHNKILRNEPEKGRSWRKMTSEQLRVLIKKYEERSDWVSVANIAFMLWENENSPVRKIPELEGMGLFKEET